MASRLQFLRDVLPWLARPTLGNAAIINADTRPGQQPATSPTIANDGVPPHVHPITRGAEFGASGTENFGGYIRREDYNPELDNFVTAVRIYDKMRMGDAQIRAMLSVIKLPLRGATWTCLPPTDGDNVDQAIADFCNHALFEDDAMESSWDSTLRHILLQLDFGFSVLEKVWKVDDEGAYRLLRLAPRLPKTIRMWHVDRNGRLKAVVQYAPVPVSTSYPAAGSGRMLPGGGQRDVPLSGIYPGVANASPVHYGTAVSFQYLEIPAEYCLVCTLEREGDNYQGRSLLRPIYRNFYFKDQAYHQEGVRLDRWGVGIPVAQLEEGHTLNQQDLDALVEVLKAVRANERAYLIAPPHVTYDLLPKTGSATAGSGASQWIDHHDQQIARNVLAGFLTMGQDPHGTLGFGSRLTDMFVSSLNGVAAGISADLKHQVVKQLCFPPTARVTLADGTRKPIAEVGIGDLVLGHDGQPHVVRETMVRDYDGPMAEIQVVGHDPIVCTPEHPLLVAAARPLFMQRNRYTDTMAVYSDDRYPYGRRGTAAIATPASTQTWRDAAAVCRGEYLLSPVVSMPGVEAPAPSPEMCSVMGWFLAEGCYLKPVRGGEPQYQGVQFTLGASDERRGFVVALLDALDSCGVDVRPVRRQRNVVIVQTRPCPDLVDQLRRECGEYSHAKHLPPDAPCWATDRKQTLLAGYWNGDGSFWESNSGHVFGFAVTRSRHLAEALVVLIESLGISCRLKRRPPSGRSKEAWEVIVSGDHCRALRRFIESGVAPDGGKRLHQKSFCADGYHHYRVKSVSQQHYRGQVFNLEVADVHSYVIDGLAAHNCDLNFDMTKRKYPRVTCRDLERVDLQNLVTTLATLSRSASPGKSGQQQPQAPGQTQEGAQEAAEKSAWLTPDDETEKLLRKLLDLPPMEESETRKSKKPVPPQAPAPIGAPPATAPGPEPPKPGANEDSAKAG
jgi:hypothetical protein